MVWDAVGMTGGRCRPWYLRFGGRGISAMASRVLAAITWKVFVAGKILAAVAIGQTYGGTICGLLDRELCALIVW